MLDLSLCEEVVWRVRPLATPRVLRHCPRCARTRAFVSSDKFRCNAQQRRLDVWLLYACPDCGRTWKREVLSRVVPEQIEGDLLERYARSDPATAWRCAYTPDAALTFAEAAEVAVERAPLPGAPVAIRLEVPWPCGVRLDRLLATELGWSRSELVQRLHDGRVVIAPLGARALRRPPRDGTRIVLGGP